MYDLVEEASKVLRNPTSEFDFENPPEDPKEIEKNLGDYFYCSTKYYQKKLKGVYLLYRL